MKIKVFLGYKIAMGIDSWRKKWERDEVNDSNPYGYDRANDKDVSIKYIKLNNLEKKLLRCSFLLKFYLYFIKLPIELLDCNVVWTHYDRDSIFIARLKGIFFLKKLLPKHIGCFVWLIDNTKDFSDRKIKHTKKLLMKIDKIVYLAYSEEEKFIDYYQIPRDKLKYIPFGINVEAYSPTKESSKPEKLGNLLPGFIFTAGTDRHRDLELFKKIVKEMPSQHFVLATGNPEYMNNEYGSNVTVLKASLKEMRWLYKNSKFVIVPLKYNEHASGCTTILEASAMNKSVIVTNTPGIDEYVVNKKTGLVVSNDGIVSFKKAIEYLSEKPDLCKDFGRAGFIHANTKFTTEIWSKNHLKISKDLLLKV